MQRLTNLKLAATLVLLTAGHVRAADTDMAAKFQSPPSAARPWVYWFWNNGLVTKSGITADLEAMQRVGIGGVLIMDVATSPKPPPGPATFMAPLWQGMFQFAVAEAQRLGLEVNMTNGPGWTGSSGPWITPELSMQMLVTSDTPIPGGTHFDTMLPKPVTATPFYEDIAVLAMPTPENGIVQHNAVIDLTEKMDKSGKLTWDASPGQWVIERIGHTTTGMTTRPPVAGGNGLECDKLSRDAADAQFAGMMARLAANSGSATGKTLVRTHIDSWEVSGQNWTPRFREEFEKRRGYDPLTYLPTVTQKAFQITDKATSDRFRWDFYQTIGDLLNENYAGRLAELAHTQGMDLSIEAYNLPFGDEMNYGARADEPMAEFWTGGSAARETMHTPREMSSIAHTNGRIITGAEAFTSGNQEKWLLTPAAIKALGDLELCSGINRFVFHRYAHQPFLDRAPGVTMGPWGLHYERTNTWWEMSSGWHLYLSRCQYMLRQGLFVADVCYLRPDVPLQGWYEPAPALPIGYAADQITAETVLTRMHVQNGRLTLPDGMSYRLMALPAKAGPMTPQLVAKIRELVAAGATIIGPPPTASPSLTDYPQCDQLVRDSAQAIWGDSNGTTVTKHTLGRGRVLWGLPLDVVLQEATGGPDFMSESDLHWIHRRAAGTDLYFVATESKTPTRVRCHFRITGKRPELWDPETGQRLPISEYTQDVSGTSLTLPFSPTGSAFIVFQKSAKADRQIVTVTRNGQRLAATTQTDKPEIDLIRGEAWQPGSYALQKADGKIQTILVAPLPAATTLAGPWQVNFPPNRGAPPQLTMPTLASWTERPEDGVKYFSGTAVYIKTVSIPTDWIGARRRVYLGLGDVQVMARVTVNGHDLGIAWKKPYRMEITSAVKSGTNIIQIAIANLWPNRLIGDQSLPEDKRYTWSNWEPFKAGDPLLPSGLLGPVTLEESARIN